MLILALDTTTREGSLAVVRDGRVLAELTGDPTITHGQRLPRDLMRALEAAGVRAADLDLLAVAAGPGSFTGLRVGIAAMQGLAFARGLRIVPISTLDAHAQAAAADAPADALLASWVDAQRGEVFASLYERDAVTVRQPPTSRPPGDTVAAWLPTIGESSVVFAGDGALRYRDVITSTLGPRATIVEPAPRLAAIIGRLAAAAPEKAVLPHAVMPVYVRRPDAELARDRRSSSS